MGHGENMMKRAAVLVCAAAGAFGGCVSATPESIERREPSMIGSASFPFLDDNSRQRASAAQQDALANSRRISWRGEKDIYGFIEPAQAADGPSAACRDYTQTVYVNGRPQRDTGRACRQPDGSWR
jgi:surface antigen